MYFNCYKTYKLIHWVHYGLHCPFRLWNTIYNASIIDNILWCFNSNDKQLNNIIVLSCLIPIFPTADSMCFDISSARDLKSIKTLITRCCLKLMRYACIMQKKELNYYSISEDLNIMGKCTKSKWILYDCYRLEDSTLDKADIVNTENKGQLTPSDTSPLKRRALHFISPAPGYEAIITIWLAAYFRYLPSMPSPCDKPTLAPQSIFLATSYTTKVRYVSI